uniref:Uncharacterized protein n=1 Tax=Prolemur simus TaxID=1328070 RepID=A0A8C9DLE0_PROSS
MIRSHYVPATSISGVATWPKFPSTYGKLEPQPAAPFPLWDLVSYFFRLWFGERNQHINDFFPQKPLNNSFWRVFAFLLTGGHNQCHTVVGVYPGDSDGLSWHVLYLLASGTYFHPTPGAAVLMPWVSFESDLECKRACP